MKRKDYLVPTVLVVRLQHRNQLLSGSPQSTQGNLGGPQSPEGGVQNWDDN